MSRRHDTRLVVSDLDGTLLDEETYDLAPARPGIEALGEHGVGLVLCSSKTRAEMEPLAADLGLDTPLIVENGGAIVLEARWLPFLPPGGQRDGDRLVIPLGSTRDTLVAALEQFSPNTDVAERSGELAHQTLAQVAFCKCVLGETGQESPHRFIVLPVDRGNDVNLCGDIQGFQGCHKLPGIGYALLDGLDNKDVGGQGIRFRRHVLFARVGSNDQL